MDIRYFAELYALDKNDQAVKKVAGASPESLHIKAHATDTGLLRIQLANPRLWSINQPNRYVVRVQLVRNGQLADSYDVPFGFRTIQFTHDRGFLLNGKSVRLQGTCNHHDMGALGTAINIHVLQRQLRILKEMGCNALRTSHNPPAPELLELADKMGFFIMDEAFDCFMISKYKNNHDYAHLWRTRFIWTFSPFQRT